MKIFPGTLCRTALLSALLMTVAGAAQAQAWPSKPVTIIVSTSSSSAADTLARLMSPRLGAMWKQSVVVENRTGASGNIGVSAVAKAAPDGYTMLFAPNTVTMVGPLYKNLGWDIEQSFEPVALLVRTVSALLVNNDLPVKNVAELIALAKRNPGELNFASPGVGTPQHLYGELFKQIQNINIVHIPYKTVAAAGVDLAGGRAQLAFLSLSAVMPMVRAGKIRILATVGEQRHAATPDVPTFKEAGIEGVQAGSWVGVFMPRGTPRDIVDRVTADINTLLTQADVLAEIRRADLLPNTNGGGQRDLATLVRADSARWKKVIADGKISAD